MAEHRGERRGERAVPLSEAAAVLGISKDAVRMRVKRGTIDHEKRDGRVYVFLHAVPDAVPDDDRGVVVSDLRDQVEYLRDQLDLRAREIERRDVIISQLTQATSNLTDRLRELEAPAEPSDAPEEEPEEAAPRPAAGGAQEAQEHPQRRSWWREFFRVGG